MQCRNGYVMYHRAVAVIWSLTLLYIPITALCARDKECRCDSSSARDDGWDSNLVLRLDTLASASGFSSQIFMPWWSIFQTDSKSIYLLNTQSCNRTGHGRQKAHSLMMTGGKQWDRRMESSRGHLQWLRQKVIYRVLNTNKGPWPNTKAWPSQIKRNERNNKKENFVVFTFAHLFPLRWMMLGCACTHSLLLW